ncbi:acetylcholine receptor subunit alpha-like isoform X2 [Lepeophtheirus salmonis]|nr:acetylcholine receptor subunit alpha-like [Lepeophtheirus salmonis]
MTTNLWVEQYWFDYKLKWDPEEYGGVRQLHVPSDHIWRPDIVLYNNADGNFEVTLATKATLWFNGLVEWKPPAIYKSSCEIDVEYFPFDEQTCVMKFGSWTYDGFQVDLRHMCEVDGTNVVPLGIDLSEFYMSVEWDILEVPAVRNEKFYTCCDEPYLDITFNITMRRKTLFYTVNLIIPCMGISFLTVLTFYLPSDSGEKVTLSISILTSLYVFFLLVVEIIPPTSLVVPLLGKYLIFAMILVSISICVTVVVLNVHFRSPQTHKMAPWVKRVFIHILPRLLIMRRPQFQPDKHTCDSRSLRKVMMRTCIGAETSTSIFDNAFSPNDKRNEVYRDHFPEPFPEDIPGIPQHRPSSAINEFSPRLPQDNGMFFSSGCQVHGTSVIMDEDEEDEFNPIDVRSISADDDDLGGLSSPLGNNNHLHSSSTGPPLISPPPYEREVNNPFDHSNCSKNLHKSCACVNFIAEHTRAKEEATKVKEDWKYVAMVLDRLFLWIFTLAVLVGTAGIILQAPSLYDDRIPIDREISDIASGFDAGVRKKESKGKFRSIQNCYPDQDK